MERFEVPEPSREAVEEGRGPVQRDVVSHWPLGRGAPWYLHDHIIAESLRVAYAVDLPGIVRAEVERALRYECRLDDPTVFLPRFDRDQAEIRIAAYLAARFREAAPETDDRSLVSLIAPLDIPAPSAPEPLTLRPEGRVLPGVPAQYTEDERAFLYALAKLVPHLGMRGNHPESAEAVERCEAAARKLVAE